MDIKLNRAVVSAPALVRSWSPHVQNHEFNAAAAKIVALDLGPERTGLEASRSDSQNVRFRLEEKFEALLARSLNLIVSKAIERKACERTDATRANIIESGLSRRPSEFFPEAA